MAPGDVVRWSPTEGASPLKTDDEEPIRIDVGGWHGPERLVEPIGRQAVAFGAALVIVAALLFPFVWSSWGEPLAASVVAPPAAAVAAEDEAPVAVDQGVSAGPGEFEEWLSQSRLPSIASTVAASTIDNRVLVVALAEERAPELGGLVLAFLVDRAGAADSAVVWGVDGQLAARVSRIDGVVVYLP